MAIDYSKQAGQKITTKGNQKICINLGSITHIQCDGDLATIFLNNNIKVDEIRTLKEYEKILSEKGFIRISRNTIVNSKYIKKLTTQAGKRILYLKDIKLEVSRRQLKFLKDYLY